MILIKEYKSLTIINIANIKKKILIPNNNVSNITFHLLKNKIKPSIVNNYQWFYLNYLFSSKNIIT